MRAYHVAVRGFNFKLMTYQKVISAPFGLVSVSLVLYGFILIFLGPPHREKIILSRRQPWSIKHLKI